MKKEIEEFKNGDIEAFETIYKMYYKKIYLFSLQYYYDQKIAEDVVQTTFMEMYKARKKLRDNEAFYSWMMQIAYRQAKQIVKKEKKRKSVIDNVSYIEGVLDQTQISLEQEITDKEMIRVIQQRIQQLKPIYKQVAILYYYEQKSIKEICQLLSLAEGTVKSRIHRVNKILRKDLEKEGLSPNMEKSFVFYGVLWNTILQNLDIQTSISISDIMEKVKVAGTAVSTLLGLKILLGSLSAIAIIGGGQYFFSEQEQGVETNIHIPNITITEAKDICYITDVSYEEHYVAGPLLLNITTSTDDYDKIEINGVDNRNVYENGDYIIDLIKNEEIIDQRVITIVNIDKNLPEVLEVTRQDEWFMIRLDDLESGLNYNSLSYYVDGVQNYNIRYNTTDNVIYVLYYPGANNKLYIEDNVGNWSYVEIISQLKEVF
ncbi:MAG: RNA polymerase sigma factor [Coprobacillaceae bacterium]